MASGIFIVPRVDIPNLAAAYSSAIFLASLTPRMFVPEACAFSGLPPPLPLMAYKIENIW